MLEDRTCACWRASRGGPGLRVGHLKDWVGASSQASRQVVVSLLPASRNLGWPPGLDFLVSWRSYTWLVWFCRCSWAWVFTHIFSSSVNLISSLSSVPNWAFTLPYHWGQSFILFPLRKSYQGSGDNSEIWFNEGLQSYRLQMKLGCCLCVRWHLSFQECPSQGIRCILCA